MERIFPGARFVLNTRVDLIAQSRSGMLAKRQGGSGASVAQLEDETLLLHAWHQRLGPKRSFWLPLTPSGFEIEQYDSLARWFGVPCRFLSIAHSARNPWQPAVQCAHEARKHGGRTESLGTFNTARLRRRSATRVRSGRRAARRPSHRHRRRRRQ